jgi:hypothetical protein
VVIPGSAPASSRPEPASSRRELLGRTGSGLIAGAALLSAGCGASQSATSTRKQISPGAEALDVVLLNELLDAEHRAIAAYSNGIPLLSGYNQRAARNFLGDEFNHASELISLIGHHGGKANRAQSSYDFGNPQSEDDLLRLFERIERQQIGVYLAAIPIATPGRMRAALAAILGSDAQHIAILRKSLGTPPLISPFVTAAG